MQPLFLHPRDLDIAAPHLFWAAPPDAALVTSLERFGQMTPALVLDAGGRPVLAAGTRRAAALRAIRGRPLAAMALAPEDMEPDLAELSPELRLGVLYLGSNLGRAVTDAMLVAAARYFTVHGSVDDFMALAGPQLFGEGGGRARQVAHWLSLPASCDALLAAGNVPLGCAATLAACDAATLAALTPLLGAMRWSRGTLVNALSFLTEAAALSGETPGALLSRCGVLELPERGLSPNDLAAGVLAGLRRLRYPATTTLEARFAALSRELTPGGSRVRLRPSQGFEADAVTVEVVVRSPAEMEKAAADLGAMAASPRLPGLLTVARADDGDAA
ncbi:conserved hypothetical protein [Solidesulfovibrio fructosivorans JJ]]|uniref:ParB domain protein nuclease n=1 Tax=Solidesulfovibrio fructosivorans JJ] TaxID=596151 RepID=E1K1T1_SOLFR|nr:hypothetical protein [Solidesulfovibrio fructosivorans]EFL49431.1 conserved hypothetical protein [Solidesulfovibrio fructosivorans JJ]]